MPKSNSSKVSLKNITYREAGVDIDAGNTFVKSIMPKVESTQRTGTMSSLGGFAGFFDPKKAGYKDPILVASTDGVGTKLKIAIELGCHETIGIDLVAMCVNDIIAQGAEPLFFLDYLATAKLDLRIAQDVISGIVKGCTQARCALIGGETAEMPSMYSHGDYDVAGFAVGAVERGGIIDGHSIQDGDIILGLSSSGLHSNGFSLVRNLISGTDKKLTHKSPFDNNNSIGDTLLTPTRIYVASCLKALQLGGVRGLAHITGGGLVENIPRILPDGMGAYIDTKSWDVPNVFKWLYSMGNISKSEMVRTFNCGIGMVMVVDPNQVQRITMSLASSGEVSYELGKIKRTTANSSGLIINNLDDDWLE